MSGQRVSADVSDTGGVTTVVPVSIKSWILCVRAQQFLVSCLGEFV